LLEWLPASVVDAPDLYPPGYGGPLDERTPGCINLSRLERRFIARDRDRLIDDARD
jgi:hypothetical protein